MIRALLVALAALLLSGCVLQAQYPGLYDDDADGDGVGSRDDCDDNDANRSPNLDEVCDGVDNDCSGAPDADEAGEVDADLDTVLSCEDCDDDDATVFPDATELCDGQDNDCNGLLDFSADGIYLFH